MFCTSRRGEAEHAGLQGQLSNACHEDTRYGDIDFAFRFNGGGRADVLENGDYRSGGDTPYAAGDVFRVAVVGGRVQYVRNGRFLVESAGSPALRPRLTRAQIEAFLPAGGPSG